MSAKNKWQIVYEQAIRNDGSLFFPEKLSQEFLDGARHIMGSYLFANQYLNEIIPSELQTFKKEWFRYFNDEDLKGKDLYYYATVDLAISKADGADNTAVVVIAKELGRPEIYVYDVYAGHFDPGQTIDYLFSLKAKFQSRFVRVGIESVAFQKALQYFIINEQKKRGDFFDIPKEGLVLQVQDHTDHSR